MNWTLSGLSLASGSAALTSVGSEKLFLDKGFQAFIPKPIDLSRLDEVIRHVVRGKTPEEPPENQEVPATEQGTGSRSESAEKVPGSADLQTFFCDSDELDIEEGLERFGSEESLIQILQSYAVNTRVLLASVREVSTESLPEYAVTVHGIKSSSYSIGAKRVGDLAKDMELAAKAGSFDTVLNANPDFLTAAENLIEEIEAGLKAKAASNPKPVKQKPDTRILQKLNDACKRYDMDEIDEAMAELDAYEYQADDGLVSWLREQTMQMNYSKIVERLSLPREGTGF